jgi:hypothetical protein
MSLPQTQYMTGVHAAGVNALIPASHRPDAWLGGAPEGESLFPRTDGDDLPANRIFLAALTSLRAIDNGSNFHEGLHCQVEPSAPVGFIQAYVVIDSGGGWWESGNDPGARGVDQFLADPDRLNQGLGTAMIRNFVASLFDDPAVTKVQTDPSPATDAASEAFTRRKPRRT